MHGDDSATGLLITAGKGTSGSYTRSRTLSADLPPTLVETL